MKRRTNTFSVLIPVAAGIRILPENDLRILYSIQNKDAANFVSVSVNPTVTAGALVATDGQDIQAGGYISDDTDLAEVFCIANTAAVWITVQEVSVHGTRKPTSFNDPFPSGHNPSRKAARTTRRTVDRIRDRLAARSQG